MIAKHEHNLAQQQAMLETVVTQLAEVRDTVGALRALVSETREPPNNPVVPPLPPPRERPPMDNGGILPTLGSAQDFLPIDYGGRDWACPVKDKQEEGAHEA